MWVDDRAVVEAHVEESYSLFVRNISRLWKRLEF
jgi:hypothetical protein